MSAIAIAIESKAATSLIDVEESAILAAYQRSEKHGLEFGRLCYDYRERHGAQGRTGKGLAQLLRKLGIKEGKAYYWIAQYEEVIGERAPQIDLLQETQNRQPETITTGVSAIAARTEQHNADLAEKIRTGKIIPTVQQKKLKPERRFDNAEFYMSVGQSLAGIYDHNNLDERLTEIIEMPTTAWCDGARHGIGRLIKTLDEVTEQTEKYRRGLIGLLNRETAQ